MQYLPNSAVKVWILEHIVFKISLKILPLHSIYLIIWLTSSRNGFHFYGQLKPTLSICFEGWFLVFWVVSFWVLMESHLSSHTSVLFMIPTEYTRSNGSSSGFTTLHNFSSNLLSKTKTDIQHTFCPSEAQQQVPSSSEWGTYVLNSMLDDLYLNLCAFSFSIWMAARSIPALALFF